MRHTIGHIDYHVVDACNLACEFCTHYSNFKGPANLKTIEQCKAEWIPWAHVVHPERFHIIGGEPLLNPQIVEIVQLAFRIWSDSTVCLYSNGLMLKKHPGLRTALSGGRYALGLHYCDDRDTQTEQYVRNFFVDAGVAIDIIDGAQGWLQFYQFDEQGKPVPYNDGNQRSSWENCIAGQQRCFVLKDGKLWKCPQVAFADRAGISYWFDGYSSCGVGDDISDWLAKEDELCCSNCPANAQLTDHGAAHMKLRLPVI